MIVPLQWIAPNRWELTEDFTIGNTVVPKGFVSDLVSAPWCLSWWVGTDGALLAAGVPHDYHYRVHDITRKQADEQFYANAIVYCNVRSSKATAAWLGLRLFGWWAWRKA